VQNAAPSETNATCGKVFPRASESLSLNNRRIGFLLDVGLLAHVLESPGGPCDQVNRSLAALEPVKDAAKIADLKKGYANLTDLITNTTNLAFFQRSLNAMVRFLAETAEPA
jgi:hypothetical protein